MTLRNRYIEWRKLSISTRRTAHRWLRENDRSALRSWWRQVVTFNKILFGLFWRYNHWQLHHDDTTLMVWQTTCNYVLYTGEMACAVWDSKFAAARCALSASDRRSSAPQFSGLQECQREVIISTLFGWLDMRLMKNNNFVSKYRLVTGGCTSRNLPSPRMSCHLIVHRVPVIVFHILQISCSRMSLSSIFLHNILFFDSSLYCHMRIKYVITTIISSFFFKNTQILFFLHIYFLSLFTSSVFWMCTNFVFIIFPRLLFFCASDYNTMFLEKLIATCYFGLDRVIVLSSVWPLSPIWTTCKTF